MMCNPIYRLVAFVVSLTVTFTTFAQEDLEISVDEPGTLAEQLLLISPDAKYMTTKLKVNGYIDGNDMMFIREMCGVKNISTPTEGKLTQLDLSDAFVVESDKPYISLYGIDFTTKSDVFGCCFLYNCRQLKELKLPVSTLVVDSFALASCSGLENIELPINLQSIGLGAFVGCDGLETLDVPNTVDTIATGAFQRMARLKELTLGNGITSIDNSLILGDDSLRVINLGGNLRSFHPIVFYTAPSLAEINVAVENQYLSSDDGVLFSHEKDTLLMFPPASEFSEYMVPAEVKMVGNSAFYGAKNLKAVFMPDSLTLIDSLAFFNCMMLESVEFGSRTESIGFAAFGISPENEPSSLSRLHLPATVAHIQGGAFFCNSSLREVTIDNDNPWYTADENGFIFDKSLSTLYFAPASADAFELPSTVKAIGEFAITGSTNLGTLYVNDNITEIGTGAFAYSSGISQLSLGKGVAKLGDMLVEGCSGLKAVYVFSDGFDDENVSEYAFLDEYGYVLEQCTLYVKPGLTDYFLTKKGFYSDEFEMFFFADIQEMEDPDGIRSLNTDGQGDVRFFTIDGQQQISARKGLNIIRLPEGRSIKRIFK